VIKHFLHTRASTESLEILPTTRSAQKATETATKLRSYVRKIATQVAGSGDAATAEVLAQRVHIRDDALVDLSHIPSIYKLAQKLLKEDGGTGDCHIDALVCNAGIGGWVGIDWLTCFYKLFTGWVTAVTFPSFKISGVGWTTKPQIPPERATASDPAPALGDVFCANLFGHYMLIHQLVPLLTPSGRIIMTSSCEAYAHAHSMDDFQGLLSKMPYESSKRLTDVLALSSELPATQPDVRRFLTYDGPVEWARKQAEQNRLDDKTRPRIYLSHPGVVGTAIIQLPLLLNWGMMLAFFIARLLGSPWHTVTSYKAAVAPTWLATAPQKELDAVEAGGKKGKWGSSVTRWGTAKPARTEVEGWGWSGVLGEQPPFGSRGRWVGAKDLTEKDRRAFELQGRECWAEMERLRKDWDERIRRAGV
jgi:3-keto steroid reductase